MKNITKVKRTIRCPYCFNVVYRTKYGCYGLHKIRYGHHKGDYCEGSEKRI